jgi:hypothetical protein
LRLLLWAAAQTDFRLVEVAMRAGFLVAVLFAVVVLSRAPIASATSAVVVGSFNFVDLDQGGWAAGPLYADGSVGGSGHFSFDNGENVGTITALSWEPAGPDAVIMCFSDANTKGTVPLFPSPMCVPLPVGSPTIVSLAPGERSLIRVTLNE